MRVVKFYGSSDDLFCIDGGRHGEPDEIDQKSSVKIVSGLEVESGLIVTASYSPAGTATWAIGISQLEEDKPLPGWPMTWETTADRQRGGPAGYSVLLSIEIPDDAVMYKVDKDGKRE